MLLGRDPISAARRLHLQGASSPLDRRIHRRCHRRNARRDAILEGTRPDRHEEFKAHYPDGYRMEFVGYEEAWAKSNAGLVAAWALNTAKRAQKAEVKP
jgi:hypothetical protein